MTGLRSRKASNVWLDWHRALAECPKLAGSVAPLAAKLGLAGAAVPGPWTGVIPLLAVASALWQLSEYKVNERPAAVVWTLYKHGYNGTDPTPARPRPRVVTRDALLELVKGELTDVSRSPMNRDELEFQLTQLTKMHCVSEEERDGQHIVWLREDVDVSDLS